MKHLITSKSLKSTI